MRNPEFYEIGRRFFFWKTSDGGTHSEYIEPKYDDLKEEVLECGLTELDLRGAWAQIEKSTLLLLKTETIKRVKSQSSDSMYRIIVNTPFAERIGNLLALKVHTDLTKVDLLFCRILRRGNPVEIAGIAHWARLLTETVQCFGSSLNVTPNKIFYRGVSQAFYFRKIVTRFNLPMSTSNHVCFRLKTGIHDR